jgi:hypothetical protein
MDCTLTEMFLAMNYFSAAARPADKLCPVRMSMTSCKGRAMRTSAGKEDLVSQRYINDRMRARCERSLRGGRNRLSPCELTCHHLQTPPADAPPGLTRASASLRSAFAVPQHAERRQPLQRIEPRCDGSELPPQSSTASGAPASLPSRSMRAARLH